MRRAVRSVLLVWLLGFAVRGPYADQSVVRDLAAGTGVVALAVAADWAFADEEVRG